MVEGGIIKHDFAYDYDLNMSVNSLLGLCQKIYNDIKTVIAENSNDKFEVIFNYLVSTDDISMCYLVAGWLNGTCENLSAVVLVEKMSHV